MTISQVKGKDFTDRRNNMLMENERKLIVEYGKKLSASGLCPGTSGNTSISNKDLGLVAISPSGIDYFETKPENVPIVNMDGKTVDGHTKPSSEIYLHLAFYRKKPEISAVVHTHSVFCSVFAALRQPVRAVHYVIGDANTHIIPCAPYRIYGSPELSEAAVEACGDSLAVLLANHGMMSCGKNIQSAFSLAKNIEYVAEIQYRAMSIGTPFYLSKAEMDEVMEKFKGYGQ